MHKLSKRFLIPAAGLAIVAVLVGLDLYVASNKVRKQVENALQRELGEPMQIGSLHYTLWSGLRARDAVCEFGGKTKGEASLAFSIPSVSARLAWYPLLSGQIVIQRLIFNSPVLTWVQGTDGRWDLNPIQRENPDAHAPRETAPQGNLATPFPTAPHHPPARKKHRGHGRLEFGIEAIRIENATLQFIDRQGRATVMFEGTNIFLRDPETPEGTLSVAKTTLRDGLVVENFAVPFVFRKKVIALAPIDAHVAGGTIRGSATLHPHQGIPTFTLDLIFNGINLTGLVSQFSRDPNAQRTGGTLEGNVDLYGIVGQKKAIEGVGQLRLREGRMDQIPLLQAIGKVLQIEELKELELHNTQLDLRATRGKVFVDSLVMESPNMALTATGASEWDGKLNLAAHLAVGPKISHQLPGWINASFQPIPGGNFREIAFNIKGSVTHPNTDLLGVLMGQKYGDQFLHLWQSLTGKGKKKGENKKKIETSPNVEEGETAP